MPDVTAILQYGTLPADGTLLDEADLLVQSLTITPAREKKEYKGTNRAVQGLSYTNPTLSFAFKAYVSEAAGLAIEHPGTAVAELANFAAAVHGFEATQGMMVFEDPTKELTNEDSDMINFTVMHYPFTENA